MEGVIHDGATPQAFCAVLRSGALAIVVKRGSDWSIQLHDPDRSSEEIPRGPMVLRVEALEGVGTGYYYDADLPPLMVAWKGEPRFEGAALLSFEERRIWFHTRPGARVRGRLYFWVPAPN